MLIIIYLVNVRELGLILRSHKFLNLTTWKGFSCLFLTHWCQLRSLLMAGIPAHFQPIQAETVKDFIFNF